MAEIRKFQLFPASARLDSSYEDTEMARHIFGSKEAPCDSQTELGFTASLNSVLIVARAGPKNGAS